MQKINYMTMGNKTRKDSIVFQHRNCAIAEKCKENCRMVKDTTIMSCVSCMKTTMFGPEGSMISEMICYEERA